MPIKVPPLPFRSRRVRRVTPSATPTPTPLAVVAVEGVSYDEPLLSFTLVFNTTAEQPLGVGELDPAKWSAVYQGGGFYGYAAEVIAFDRVSVTVQADAPATGADAVSYANAPSDVSDTTGRQLAAFDAFPL